MACRYGYGIGYFSKSSLTSNYKKIMKKIITIMILGLTSTLAFAQSGEELINTYKRGDKLTESQLASMAAYIESAKPVVTSDNVAGIQEARGVGHGYVAQNASKAVMLANATVIYDSIKRAWAIKNKDADVAKTVNLSMLHGESAITFLNFYYTEVLKGMTAIEKVKEFNRLGDFLGNEPDVLMHYNNLIKVLVNKAKLESEIGKM